MSNDSGHPNCLSIFLCVRLLNSPTLFLNHSRPTVNINMFKANKTVLRAPDPDNSQSAIHTVSGGKN